MLQAEASHTTGQKAAPVLSPCTVRVLDAGEPLILALEGEADIDCASACFYRLQKAVCDGNYETIIVDLSACNFMDSFVLKTLIRIDVMARERDRKFILYNPTPNLRQLFERMRLEKVITIIDSPTLATTH